MIAKGYNAKPLVPSKGYAADLPPLPESFSLTAGDLKSITAWKVGKVYDLRMTVKLVSQSKDSTDQTMRARFEIQSVEPDDGSGEDD